MTDKAKEDRFYRGKRYDDPYPIVRIHLGATYDPMAPIYKLKLWDER